MEECIIVPYGKRGRGLLSVCGLSDLMASHRLSRCRITILLSKWEMWLWTITLPLCDSRLHSVLKFRSILSMLRCWPTIDSEYLKMRQSDATYPNWLLNTNEYWLIVYWEWTEQDCEKKGVLATIISCVKYIYSPYVHISFYLSIRHRHYVLVFDYSVC